MYVDIKDKLERKDLQQKIQTHIIKQIFLNFIVLSQLIKGLPKDTRSAVASRLSQKDTHESTTSSMQGP